MHMCRTGSGGWVQPVLWVAEVDRGGSRQQLGLIYRSTIKRRQEAIRPRAGLSRRLWTRLEWDGWRGGTRWSQLGIALPPSPTPGLRG